MIFFEFWWDKISTEQMSYSKDTRMVSRAASSMDMIRGSKSQESVLQSKIEEIRLKVAKLEEELELKNDLSIEYGRKVEFLDKNINDYKQHIRLTQTSIVRAEKIGRTARHILQQGQNNNGFIPEPLQQKATVLTSAIAKIRTGLKESPSEDEIMDKLEEIDDKMDTISERIEKNSNDYDKRISIIELQNQSLAQAKESFKKSIEKESKIKDKSISDKSKSPPKKQASQKKMERQKTVFTEVPLSPKASNVKTQMDLVNEINEAVKAKERIVTLKEEKSLLIKDVAALKEIYKERNSKKSEERSKLTNIRREYENVVWKSIDLEKQIDKLRTKRNNLNVIEFQVSEAKRLADGVLESYRLVKQEQENLIKSRDELQSKKLIVQSKLNEERSNIAKITSNIVSFCNDKKEDVSKLNSKVKCRVNIEDALLDLYEDVFMVNSSLEEEERKRNDLKTLISFQTSKCKSSIDIFKDARVKLEEDIDNVQKFHKSARTKIEKLDEKFKETINFNELQSDTVPGFIKDVGYQLEDIYPTTPSRRFGSEISSIKREERAFIDLGRQQIVSMQQIKEIENDITYRRVARLHWKKTHSNINT